MVHMKKSKSKLGGFFKIFKASSVNTKKSDLSARTQESISHDQEEHLRLRNQFQIYKSVRDGHESNDEEEKYSSFRDDLI